jgi:hypothetical protein
MSALMSPCSQSTSRLGVCRSSFARLASVLLCGLPLIGCGKAESPFLNNLVNVSGIVYMDDQPVEGVQVTLIPTVKNTGGRTAYGLTDASGRFSVASPEGGTVAEMERFRGALPGDYVVTFNRFVLPDGSVYDPINAKEGPQVVGAEERMNPQYTDATRSPVKVTIDQAGNASLEFKLPGATKTAEKS